MVGKHANELSHRLVVGYHPPRVSVGPQILTRKETKRSPVSDGPDLPALVCSTMGLSAVLDDLQPAAICNRHDRVHVCGMPIQVDRDNGLRTVSKMAFNERGIDRVK